MSGVRHENHYLVVADMAQQGYTISEVCRALSISRTAYYRWLHRSPSARERENTTILLRLTQLYQQYRGIYGYRRLGDEYNARYHTNYNDKRFHRLAKIGRLRAIIRTKQPAPHAAPPVQLPANILARNFACAHTNEKWLTDITEFQYASGKKLYLSAILDLKANDIVAYTISPHNNNNLVFTTFDRAIAKYPDAHPLVHSDRGFQYTNPKFKIKLRDQGMLQSMSRPGMCIDNAPMEAFWGILKSEMYHLGQFNDYDTLAQAISDYIHFYNTQRRQRRLDRLPPSAYRRRIEQQEKTNEPND